MELTPKQAYDLSLLSNYQPYENTVTVEDLIISLLLDQSLQKDYQDNEMFCRNMEQIKTICPSEYKDFIIESFFDDNHISGVVFYKLRWNDATIFAIRGSEEYDAVRGTTKWQDWNDNFHMFLKGPTYQQIKTLDQFYEEETQDRIYLCGHSKGGNLALFLTLACREEDYQRIEKAFAFNAPGITVSLMEAYEQRRSRPDFNDKIELYENEHDCISMYFQHLKEPYIVRSNSMNTTFIQLFHNHNLYTMMYEDGAFVKAAHKTAIPRMVDHFVNGYFAKLPQKRLKIIVERMDDYFNSDLPLSDLYRVFIYQISKYTSFFDDLSYDEITTITFHDLIEKRKSRLLLEKLKTSAPKLLEVDIHQLGNILIENYEVFLQDHTEKMQKLINRNNRKVITIIREIQNVKTKRE